MSTHTVCIIIIWLKNMTITKTKKKKEKSIKEKEDRKIKVELCARCPDWLCRQHKAPTITTMIINIM